MRYVNTIEQLTHHLGYELGEAFQGSDDPTILEEYYFWGPSPDFATVRAFLINKIPHRWVLNSNVLTIYKDYGSPQKI